MLYEKINLKLFRLTVLYVKLWAVLGRSSEAAAFGSHFPVSAYLNVWKWLGKHYVDRMRHKKYLMIKYEKLWLKEWLIKINNTSFDRTLHDSTRCDVIVIEGSQRINTTKVATDDKLSLVTFCSTTWTKPWMGQCENITQR